MNGSIQRHLRQQRPFRSLEQEAFVGLLMAADRVLVPWAQHLRERADLTHAQYNVLRILRGAEAEGGLGAGEIARRLVTRSPDVTRLVDRLEARRLVRRAPDPVDRRAVRVRITPAGLAQVASLDPVVESVLERPFTDFEPGQLVALRDALARILDTVEPLED